MRKPKEGIDYYGINELKEHKWMKNDNDNFDKKYYEGNDKIGDEIMKDEIMKDEIILMMKCLLNF